MNTTAQAPGLAGTAGISAARPASRIVVGVDNTPAGLAALRWAVNQARSAGEPLVAVRSWALGLPRHGGRRRRRPARVHPHVVLAFDGSEQRGACAELVRRSFRVVSGGIPRDISVTIQTPEGDPAAVLAGIATGSGDMLVLGREPAMSLHRVIHGSVGRYLCGHAVCPVVLVPAGGDRAGGDPDGADPDGADPDGTDPAGGSPVPAGGSPAGGESW